jgi:hypothetical protein
VALVLCHPANAQRAQASGAVTITNKGISLIPALTLGKPAAIFDVAITDGALSFEPQFRFGLDGKPWSFIFWGRYRPLREGRFRLTIGAHPALSFKTITDSIGGAQRSTIVTRRYFAGDVYPSFLVAPNVSVGPYYFYAHGLDPEAFQHTHFVGARAALTNLPISGQFFIQFTPQLYYLWMDRQDGVYVTGVLTLANRKLPFAVSSLVNSPLQSSIAGGQTFLWNVSLIYNVR